MLHLDPAVQLNDARAPTAFDSGAFSKPRLSVMAGVICKLCGRLARFLQQSDIRIHVEHRAPQFGAMSDIPGRDSEHRRFVCEVMMRPLYGRPNGMFVSRFPLHPANPQLNVRALASRNDLILGDDNTELIAGASTIRCALRIRRKRLNEEHRMFQTEPLQFENRRNGSVKELIAAPVGLFLLEAEDLTELL